MQEKNQKILKKIARQSIKNSIKGKKVDLKHFFNKEIPEELKKKTGAFVTLNKNDKLRGCVGRIKEEKLPIYKLIPKMAVAAALKDNRFMPVTISELDDIDINISILSPLKKTNKPNEDIKIGKHGVYVKKDFKSAVFLPEVAKEAGWNLEELMNNLLKKGRIQGGWRKGDINIYTFTTNSF